MALGDLVPVAVTWYRLPDSFVCPAAYPLDHETTALRFKHWGPLFESNYPGEVWTGMK